MKKGFIIFITFMTMFLLVTPNTLVSAEEKSLDLYFPTDIEEHWAYGILDDLINADILNGYVDKDGNVTIKPNQPISRAEFVALLVRSLDLQPGSSLKQFEDVPEEKWYYEPITIAASLGIVNGVSETHFAPEKNIKRDEIAKIIALAFQDTVLFEGEEVAFSDVPDYWGKPFIRQVSRVGIITGYEDGTFRPAADAKRAEAATMLYRALQLESSDLPEEQMLFDLIKEKETKSIELINQQQFDLMPAYSKQYYTGYFKAYADNNIKQYKEMYEQGYTSTFTLKDELSFETLERSNRFTAVEVSGAVYDVETNGPDYHEKMTIDSSAIYLLKKMKDGQWKVYMIYYLEDQQ